MAPLDADSATPPRVPRPSTRRVGGGRRDPPRLRGPIARWSSTSTARRAPSARSTSRGLKTNRFVTGDGASATSAPATAPARAGAHAPSGQAGLQRPPHGARYLPALRAGAARQFEHRLDGRRRRRRRLDPVGGGAVALLARHGGGSSGEQGSASPCLPASPSSRLHTNGLPCRSLCGYTGVERGRSVASPRSPTTPSKGWLSRPGAPRGDLRDHRRRGHARPTARLHRKQIAHGERFALGQRAEDDEQERWTAGGAGRWSRLPERRHHRADASSTCAQAVSWATTCASAGQRRHVPARAFTVHGRRASSLSPRRAPAASAGRAAPPLVRLACAPSRLPQGMNAPCGGLATSAAPAAGPHAHRQGAGHRRSLDEQQQLATAATPTSPGSRRSDAWARSWVTVRSRFATPAALADRPARRLPAHAGRWARGHRHGLRRGRGARARRSVLAGLTPPLGGTRRQPAIGVDLNDRVVTLSHTCDSSPSPRPRRRPGPGRRGTRLPLGSSPLPPPSSPSPSCGLHHARRGDAVGSSGRGGRAQGCAGRGGARRERRRRARAHRPGAGHAPAREHLRPLTETALGST